jgi:DHA1 family inner membrane transport protein
MSYLRNRTVNLLNLHYGIHAFAMNGGGVFFAVFLLRAGIPIPVVLGSVSALQYPVMAEVHGISFSLLALCVVGSVGDTLYWTCYHAHFAVLGNVEHRGHQIGAREARGAFRAAVSGVLIFVTDGWIAASRYVADDRRVTTAST